MNSQKLLDKCSHDFKEDLIRQQKRQGNTLAYLGNGASDYHAATTSDLPLAITGSKLANLLNKNRIPCTTTSRFQEVIESIKNANPQV